MQVAIITGPTCVQLKSRLLQAKEKLFGVELRLDLFQDLCIKSLQTLRKFMPSPLIFTLRSEESGGGWTQDKDKQLDCIRSLLALKPDFIDLEHTTDANFLEEIRSHHPEIGILLSYHNFHNTPINLEEIFQKLQRKDVDVYKICTQANSVEDSYKMLRFVQNHSSHAKIIGICMGSLGIATRRDGLKFGNFFNYRVLNKKDICAPGLIF